MDRQAEEDILQAVLGSLGEGTLGNQTLHLDIQVLELDSLPQVHQGIRLQVHQGIQHWELLQVQGMPLQVPGMLLHLQLLVHLLHVWSRCELPSLQPAYPSSRLQAEMMHILQSRAKLSKKNLQWSMNSR